ncbi:hypothetical protein AJ80_01427 [Polytolypa hystricis UAMH7299]|uniref:Uncharacterized protein n=1 Tax=Polytolypa hystricis (strain UAMH7299) TaxID=1447883 RepID=A0A2B7YYU4_POLH7|nr:hypothetical protein AJ80_01427 [Polytolypa hystricis UAMH7299]
MASHVAQFYFDQALIDEVEKIAPYAENTQSHAKNAGDFIMRQGSEGEGDPVFHYVLLGDSAEDELPMVIGVLSQEESLPEGS